MKLLTKIFLLSALLILGEIVYPVPLAAAALIYDATDPDLVRQTSGISGTTGIQNVAGAAQAVPNGSSVVILAGHGESGVLGLGSGASGSYHKGKDLMYDKLQDVKADLDLINQRLGPDSIVILSGCNTGKDPHGKTLLQQMSLILTKATIFANKECVGLTRDLKKGSVCTAEGNKYWQQSSILAAQKSVVAQANRDQFKRMNAASCVP
ncbi:unnamed protein product [Candidatus Paraburkholderia kirkii UZHbot1]|uniref:WGS project CAFE00000000 data, contig bkir_c195 n=1 Tax=Candidatus Paraburkholderia kirkii UZHbot1 TaxID=1055526 RepID=U3UAS9_9BURK|nr:unnamed protein product [Candidatus Paraburkholderia kirkii UZHbot1]